jgi:pSer/pThr/pTyr-binding forkhead associated (FHA) protein
MRVLHLVITARDLLTGEIAEHWFARSPVTIGRLPENVLCLDAPPVSGYHGTFTFGAEPPLRYVDFGSTNGSYIDGNRIEPNELVTLNDWSVVGVAPYLLIVRLALAPPRDSADDTEPRTPVSQDSPIVSPFNKNIVKPPSVSPGQRLPVGPSVAMDSRP